MSDESSENKINCQHTIADMERGELICLDTGEVISTIIDSGPEWRDFSSQAERSRSRAGTPLTFRMHDHGLTTYTSESDIKKLPFRKRRKFIELKRKNTAIRMSKNKRMVKALQILNDEARKLGLPQKVTETAAYYIKKVVEKGLGRGEMIRAYVAASLFMACRLMKVPRTFYSVIISVGADEEKVRYAQRKIVEIQGGKINAKVTKPKDYIPMITSKLGLSMQSENLMYRLANAIEKLNMDHGKSPIALAAATAYIASSIFGEKKNQKDIASALGNFTDVAIRNRYREIIDKLYIEVNL